jgi:hypothetical protein
MWIKWKYNDHAWPDFKELEVPDWALKEYDSEEESILNYIIDNCNIPTWSERYMSGRIKWEKVEKTHTELQDIIRKKINGLRVTIRGYQDQMNQLKKQLDDPMV